METEDRSEFEIKSKGTYPGDRNHERGDYHAVSLDSGGSKRLSFHSDSIDSMSDNRRRTQTVSYKFGEQ